MFTLGLLQARQASSHQGLRNSPGLAKKGMKWSQYGSMQVHVLWAS